MKKVLKVIVKSLLVIIGILLTLFVIFYFATMGDYEMPETVEQNPSIPHIKIDNTIFHLETFGNDSNEVVIALHGGPGNDYRYLLDLKELANDYFVVFYDQRGTGLSPRVNAEEMTIENMIDDLNNIIDHYSQGRQVNLIGHSWGGMLASGYLAQFPEKINKIVLAEPGMLTSEKAAEFMEKFQPEFSFSFLWHVGKCWFQSLHVKGPDDQAAQDYFFEAFAFNASTSVMKKSPMSMYFCNRDMETASFAHWRYSYLANRTIFMSGIQEDGTMKLDLVSGVEYFPNKVLFMIGECNQLIGEEYQKEQMKYFNNPEMVIIKNAGHTMIGEQPKQCLDAIRKYFNE
ncbi:MAG: alpha/beta hydrolase [Bacteroidales bacterium]|nr:alpha/beta hydrolase [Bacteroidales bacterium]